MDDQQKGTDLPEKLKTRLPFSPSPFWKPFNTVRISRFQDGGDVTNPVVPLYLASKVPKRSNAPVPGQKSATKVSKSCAIPPYVPGVNPPGWPLISALYEFDYLLTYATAFGAATLESRNAKAWKFKRALLQKEEPCRAKTL